MTSRLDDLTRMRAELWGSIEDCPVDKRAPLFARLESVIEQIERLSKPEGVGDVVDEIAARRAARSGAATRSGRSKRTS